MISRKDARNAKKRFNISHSVVASLREYSFLLLFLCSLLIALGSLTCAQHIHIGAEVLVDDKIDLLYKSKRIGVICNQTSVFPDGTHLVDSLISLGVKVTTLFGPEHGIRGTAGAGEVVENEKDITTGLPVHSLYGKTKKPTAEMLKNVDILLFDIQDVGARFYTYASTMAYAMQAAAENGKKFIILDRPNPINGITVEGPVLDTALKSFVGLFPIPIRHGMTLGELAKMIVGERWLGEHSNVDLTIIPMEGWNRKMWHDQTGLPWVSPSPNMKTLATATVYPGTCLFEATNVTVARGTEKPFEIIGAPWIQGPELADTMNTLHLPGVIFEPMSFTPKPDSIAAPNPQYKNLLCGGVFIHVTNRDSFQSVNTGFVLYSKIHKLYPHTFEWKNAQFDRLVGRSSLRTDIGEKETSAQTIEAIVKAHTEDFIRLRTQYLLY
jgi:uncharacterized protein YbbC (DUF1343 family)